MYINQLNIKEIRGSKAQVSDKKWTININLFNPQLFSERGHIFNIVPKVTVVKNTKVRRGAPAILVMARKRAKEAEFLKPKPKS